MLRTTFTFDNSNVFSLHHLTTKYVTDHAPQSSCNYGALYYCTLLTTSHPAQLAISPVNPPQHIFLLFADKPQSFHPSPQLHHHDVPRLPPLPPIQPRRPHHPPLPPHAPHAPPLPHPSPPLPLHNTLRTLPSRPHTDGSTASIERVSDAKLVAGCVGDRAALLALEVALEVGWGGRGSGRGIRGGDVGMKRMGDEG